MSFSRLSHLSIQSQEKDHIEYDAFPENRKLCIVDCTNEYVLQRSAKVDETVAFIITHGKPHMSASDYISYLDDLEK